MNFLANLSFVFSCFLGLIFLITFVAYLRSYTKLTRVMEGAGEKKLLVMLARLERDNLVSVVAPVVGGSFVLSLALLILGLLFKVFA